MADANQEVELRFIKLMMSSMLKTIEQLHPEVDAHASVRQHMLGICAGVRQRSLDAVTDDVSPEQATAQVDALITTINEYFEYSGSPMFPGVELVQR
jgi:hypothetical protein